MKSSNNQFAAIGGNTNTAPGVTSAAHGCVSLNRMHLTPGAALHLSELASSGNDQALQSLTDMAMSENPDAQHALGHLYLNSGDNSAAEAWLCRAANHDHLLSIVTLIGIYSLRAHQKDITALSDMAPYVTKLAQSGSALFEYISETLAAEYGISQETEKLQ